MSEASKEEQEMFNTFKDDDKLAYSAIATFDGGYRKGWAKAIEYRNSTTGIFPVLVIIIMFFFLLWVSYQIGYIIGASS